MFLYPKDDYETYFRILSPNRIWLAVVPRTWLDERIILTLEPFSIICDLFSSSNGVNIYWDALLWMNDFFSKSNRSEADDIETKRC